MSIIIEDLVYITHTAAARTSKWRCNVGAANCAQPPTYPIGPGMQKDHAGPALTQVPTIPSNVPIWFEQVTNDNCDLHATRRRANSDWLELHCAGTPKPKTAEGHLCLSDGHITLPAHAPALQTQIATRDAETQPILPQLPTYISHVQSPRCVPRCSCTALYEFKTFQLNTRVDVWHPSSCIFPRSSGASIMHEHSAKCSWPQGSGTRTHNRTPATQPRPEV